MAQTLYPKKGPGFQVVKSWQDGVFHIALQPNGAYCHITGLVIKTEAELRAVQGVMTREEMEAAITWFKHRHDVEEEGPTKRIVFDKSGTPFFEDGSLPTRADIMNYFDPGPAQDVALDALTKKFEEQKEADRLVRETKGGQATAKLTGAAKTAREQKMAEMEGQQVTV